MSIAEIDEEIARIYRVKPHLRDLGDVADQERLLARLTAERNALTGGQK